MPIECYTRLLAYLMFTIFVSRCENINGLHLIIKMSNKMLQYKTRQCLFSLLLFEKNLLKTNYVHSTHMCYLGFY